jgi:hypothetical protein
LISANNTRFYNFANGVYYYNATACDILNNCNTTETRTLNVDLSAPSVILTGPQNATITNRTSINFTANFSDNSGLANATLNIYNQTRLYNQTTVQLGGALQNTIGIIVNLVEGVYTWFWNVVDLANNFINTQTNPGNQTITIDTTNPIISIVYPLNGTVYEYRVKSSILI